MTAATRRRTAKPKPVADPIRVAIADDHVLFCTGIQMLVELQPDMTFVGSAFDGVEAVELAAREQPDVVLMDIRMPHGDGISATARLREGHDADSGPKVIILTTHQGGVAVREALAAGAQGFLLKDATPEFLLAAIREVQAGNSVITPGAARDFVRQVTEPAPVKPNPQVLDRLTPREREVFLLAARGLSKAEIAQAAFIGENTVKTHISTILRKLGLASRLQLIAFAYEHGLVQ